MMDYTITRTALGIAFALAMAATSGLAEEAKEHVASITTTPPLLQDAASIDIDALTLESDFTLFMRRDIDETLRLKALRRLWTLMPHAPVDHASPF
jgi:hypothetical protein